MSGRIYTIAVHILLVSLATRCATNQPDRAREDHGRGSTAGEMSVAPRLASISHFRDNIPSRQDEEDA